MASWQPLYRQPSFSADTMLLLTDGTVMVHELNTPRWHRLTPDSTGSYLNGTWTPLASIPDNSAIPADKGGPTNAPLFFASAVLADGTVFVAGGENNSGKQEVELLAAELYDPLTDAWTILPTPEGWTQIGDAPTCVLADGRLLLGYIYTGVGAVFDPATQAWTATGSKDTSCSEETFTLLPNGNVLTVEVFRPPQAQQYHPSTNTWISAGSTGIELPLSCKGSHPKCPDGSDADDEGSEIGPAFLLPDGRVFAVGGTGATALYTPDPDPTMAGTWTDGPTLTNADGSASYPMDTPGVLLANGKILIASGPAPPCCYPGPTSLFLYDPATNTAAQIPGPSNAGGAPYGARMLLLPTGQVLYSASLPDIEVYTPDPGGEASWKPVITDCPNTLLLCHSYQISGTQFNGLSQACSYGDDAQMATNYPIVRIQSGDQVSYLRTSGHSTMGVATGDAIVSTNIFVPTSVPTGPAELVVIANGIASDPVAVTVDVGFCWGGWTTIAQGQTTPGGTVTAIPWKTGLALFLVDSRIAGVFTATGIPGVPETWGPWRLVSNGNSAPGATVTPVPWNDQIALFIVDNYGGVFMNVGDPDGDWQGWSSAAQGLSVQGGTVTAVPWKDGFALFLVDPNAGVFTATGIPGVPETWGPWRTVSYGNSAPGATVTPIPWNDQIAVFILDTLGGVFMNLGEPDGDWQGWSSVAQGQSVPGGKVAAVPWKDGFALFLVDPNAGVFTATGIPGVPETWGPWRTVSYGNSKPGAPITPVPYNDRIALFSTDLSGGVYTNLGNPDADWQGWSSVSQGQSVPGAMVTATAWGNGFALFLADSGGGVFGVVG